MVGPTKAKPSAFSAFEIARETSFSGLISARLVRLLWTGVEDELWRGPGIGAAQDRGVRRLAAGQVLAQLEGLVGVDGLARHEALVALLQLPQSLSRCGRTGQNWTCGRSGGGTVA